MDPLSRQSSLVPQDDVDFGKAEVVVAAKEVAGKVSHAVHRMVGDTRDTLDMVDRLTNQVKVLSESCSMLSKSLTEATTLNMQLLLTLNQKKK